jgi:hypothetical protein
LSGFLSLEQSCSVTVWSGSWKHGGGGRRGGRACTRGKHSPGSEEGLHIGYSLTFGIDAPADRCSHLTAHCSLLTAHCSLLTADCLRTVHWLPKVSTGWICTEAPRCARLWRHRATYPVYVELAMASGVLLALSCPSTSFSKPMVAPIVALDLIVAVDSPCGSRSVCVGARWCIRLQHSNLLKSKGLNDAVDSSHETYHTNSDYEEQQ